MRRPNVLLLYTDQQRWDALGAAGNPHIHTPNLDRLAAEGLNASHCFANHPLCQPSRASMLSGRYAESTGVRFNGIEMPADIPCLWHLLRPYGYHCAQIGKLHFHNHMARDHRDPVGDYGFDTCILSDEPGCYDDAYIAWVRERAREQVDDCRVSTHSAYRHGPSYRVGGREMEEPYVFGGPEDCTHTVFVGEETRDFLRRRVQHDDPFFCIAGFYAPHPPLNPPRRFLERYDPISLPPPQRLPGQGEGSDADWRWRTAHYYALVSQVDEEVGRILDTLDETGLAADTLVIFTSDHGEYCGDHGRSGKIGPEDPASRVPLLVRWPGRVPPALSDALIEQVDLAPTVLDCCGIQIPTFMQGRSFRDLAEGRHSAHREDAYLSISIPLGGAYRALRTADHLYVRQPAGSRLYRHREALFDCRRDPAQLHNLVDDPDHAPVVAACRDRLLERWFDVDSNHPRRTDDY